MKINNKVVDIIKSSKNIAIFVHNKPDGDCLGSALALKIGLKQLSINVDIFCDDIISKSFEFLPEIDTINSKTLDKYDLALALDTANPTMLGKNIDLFYSIDRQLKIDHHIEGQKFTPNEFIVLASSTALIVYNLLKALNIKLTLDIATCLYTGITCDTGCFRYSYLTKEDYLATAELVKLGVNTIEIVRNFFVKNTKLELELKKRTLNHMQFYDDIVVGYITYADLKELGITENDTHSLIDMFNVVEGYRLSVMLCEVSKNTFKASIRSHDNGSASRLAKYFGGGGHLDAAGCRIFGTLKSVINQIVKAGTLTNDRIS